jgi:hypothetical protein
MLRELPDIIDERSPKTFSLSKKLGRVIRAFDFLTVDGMRLSEDFSFCHRWREKCGGEIWANISHEITHVGIRQFRARYSDVPGSGVRTIEMPITALVSHSKTAKPKS